MTIEVKNGKEITTIVEEAVAHHGATREALIPILSEVNDKVGYLPVAAMTEISRILDMPNSQLLSTASFYHMLSIKPQGTHVIEFCDSAPCHVVGGRLILETLQEELGLEPDATSEDGQWTLRQVSCLGICGVGPVMIVDGDVYGNLEPDHIPEILARYK